MTSANKVIVSCAVTGSAHTPTMNPALPVEPEDIAGQALDAAAAGAAILHLHARTPGTGEPTPDPDVYSRFLGPLHAETDAILNITTGGSTRMSLPDRLAAAQRFEPELASLNMGSMNFNFSGAAERYHTWKHDWELPYVLGSRDVIFSNTFAEIEHTVRTLGTSGTRFEFECYDIGHLYTLAHFLERGIVTAPLLIQGIFGILGGIGADHDNLGHMLTIADKLFGDQYHFSAFAAGRHQMSFVTQSALRGGHVRVGLEDSIFIARGELARSNAEQVQKVVRILTELGREIATPQEVRRLLDLKGQAAVRM